MEKNTLDDPVGKLSNNRPMLPIAGLLLIIAGALAIITWISVIVTDVAMIDISLFQRVDSSITAEKVKDFYVICGTIGCILSVFPILGGIVALKRKMRGLALTGGIIGLFLIGPVFITSILSLIGLILIAKSKKEFHGHSLNCSEK